MNTKVQKTVFILSIILLLVLISLVVSHRNFIIDEKVFDFINNFISDKNTKVMKEITHLGSAKILFIIFIILLLCNKNKLIGLTIGINLLLSSNLNFWIKQIIRRPRPTNIMLIKESGFSFPSGHTMTSITFYGFLAYLTIKYVKNKYLKITILTILSVLMIIIPLSRIYLKVHYTTDIIGGILCAIIYLIIFINLTKKYGLIK